MSGSIILSVLALFFYTLTFLFFIRLLSWKRYTTNLIWNRKKKITLTDLHYISNHKKQPLPKISLLIPARDESFVIAQTIENLLKIEYPKELFEIIIITDEREEIARFERIDTLLSEWESYLPDHPSQLSHESINMFKIYRLNQGSIGEFYYSLWVEFGSIIEPASSADLVLNKLKRVTEKALFRYLSHVGTLKGNIQISLRTEFPLTDRVILEQLVPRIEKLLETFLFSFNFNLIKTEAKQALTNLILSTKGVAQQWQEKAKKTGHQVKILEVPISYQGSHSTKGRALNFALDQLEDNVLIVGFYDAESRPDPEVLLYVANEYLHKGEKLPILQGPLFQVRNFYSLSLVSKLGGLFKAVSHDWYLPIIFKTIPFVGGTNLFVRKSLILSVHGFDPQSLTEDLDFGVRAFLETGTVVEFLPVISTEQTPPKLRQYFVQRLRWASGHLEVMHKIRKHRVLYWQLFLKGPLEWIVYQTSGLVVIAMNINFLLSKLHLIKPNFLIHNPYIVYGFAFLNIPYLLFSVYCLNRYEYTFDKNLQVFNTFPPFEWLKLIISSMFIFLLPLPYTWAIILRLFGKQPRRWVKTQRSIE
jgi:cellulose synthase/poly-beta-1,6-N-acetylglucosamine synthase-like glycosyltransferase